MSAAGRALKTTFYICVFAAAGYSALTGDRHFTTWVLPPLLGICAWWIWTDIRITIEQFLGIREGERTALISRIEQLEDRVSDLENR